ncbi:MAG: hypothetical protein AAF738_08675, partial [Bacteroidota bacterium]
MNKQFTFLALGLLLLLSTSSTVAQVQLGTNIYGTLPGERSGEVVSMSAYGTRIAIGEKLNDANGMDAGRVRVFELHNGQWRQMGSDLLGEAAGDWFGAALDLSTNGFHIAVGAPNNDSNGNNAGQVRVFDFVGNDWVQAGADIDGLHANERAGTSVALVREGSTIAIGAPGNNDIRPSGGEVRTYFLGGSPVAWQPSSYGDLNGDANTINFGKTIDWRLWNARHLAISSDNTATGTGQVQVFRTFITTSQVGSTITDAFPSASYKTGESIALSQDGQYLAVGAPQYNPGGLSNAGQVRIFAWSPSLWDWVEVGTGLQGTAAGDALGTSVALSADGSRLLVGIRRNLLGGNNMGSMQLYERSGSSWAPVGTEITEANGGAASIGGSVAISAHGDIVATGNIFNDDIAPDAGITKVFSFPEDCLGSFNNPVAGAMYAQQAGEAFGNAVAISADGTTVVASAPSHDVNAFSNEGIVRIISLDAPNNRWITTAEVLGQSIQEKFGYKVTISDDGKRVAGSAAFNNDNGVLNVGVVRVFEHLTPGGWTQIGIDIRGNQANDLLGSSIDLSRDGIRLAVGADQLGGAEGYVRVFEYNGSSWMQLGTDLVGENIGDKFGNAVALSEDGSRLAIGVPESSAGTYGGGYIRIFEWVAGNWVQLGTDIYGKGNERAGNAVALS